MWLCQFFGSNIFFNTYVFKDFDTLYMSLSLRQYFEIWAFSCYWTFNFVFRMRSFLPLAEFVGLNLYSEWPFNTLCAKFHKCRTHRASKEESKWKSQTPSQTLNKTFKKISLMLIMCDKHAEDKNSNVLRSSY